MLQERWVVLEEPQAEELSWHKTKEAAIARATQYHQREQGKYSVGMELVPITRNGKGEPVESWPNQWGIG